MSEKNLNDNKKEIMRRLIKIRAGLIIHYPFYGNLLMHLSFALEKCETACTDMKRIIFDPEFLERLTDEEVEFVMCHELMHCVLKHCERNKGFNKVIYNIAADIVVNSNIMRSMNKRSFIVDGEEAIHRIPFEDEGYNYTAEQVYDMLINHYDEIDALSTNMDNHDIWEQVSCDELSEDEWKQHILQAMKASGDEDTPLGVRKLVENIKYEARLNWRSILNEFIQLSFDNFDYNFAPPDKRYSDSEFILPAFNELESEIVENIWFLVDTSASMDDEVITEIYFEIRNAINQFDSLKAYISFFDNNVTSPEEFSNLKSFNDINPVGGGGTNYHKIFEYMKENMSEKLPVAVIILTDGYAVFPDEKMALGLPVLWIITEDDPNPSFGTVIRLPHK